jgi:probable phosphoglycerate mutase
LDELAVSGKRSAEMSEQLPVVYLARHAETEWSLSGQHTGLTDLPLTERGEAHARQLATRLRGLQFAKVFTSPLKRAAHTGEICGFQSVAVVDPDLVEWNYGQYEGRRTSEIRKENPNWFLFRDGCPDGESPAQVAARADRVVGRIRAITGNVLLFSSGHFLRMLAARWLGLEPLAAQSFILGTASLSALSYEHNRAQPAVELWNDMDHLAD